jgi:hypothetical protein
VVFLGSKPNRWHSLFKHDAIAVSVNIEINEKTTDNALTRFATELLDGYDHSS